MDCRLLLQWDKESQGTVVVVDSVHCWYNGTRNHRGQLWWWTVDCCYNGTRNHRGQLWWWTHCWYNGTRNHRGQLWWWTVDCCYNGTRNTGDSCGGGLCTLLVQWDKESQGTVVVVDCRLLLQWDKESQGTVVMVDCRLLLQWDKESQGTVVMVDSVQGWYNGTRNHKGQLWW